MTAAGDIGCGVCIGKRLSLAGGSGWGGANLEGLMENGRVKVLEARVSVEETLRKIGEVVGEVRGERGLSAPTVAKMAGVYVKAVKRMERGINAQFDELFKLTDALDMVFELRYPVWYMQGDKPRVGRWDTQKLNSKPEPWVTIGNILHAIRNVTGDSQRGLAERHGLSQSVLSVAEHAGGKMSSVVLFEVLKAYGVELSLIRLEIRWVDIAKIDGGESEILVNIGRIIRDVRDGRGLSARFVGREIEFHGSALSNREKGGIDLTVYTFIRITEFLGIGVELVYVGFPCKGHRISRNLTASEMPAVTMVDITKAPDHHREIIGEAIKTMREARGWSLRDLAGVAGLDNSKIAKLEKGHYGMLMTTLVKILRSLNIGLVMVYSVEE